MVFIRSKHSSKFNSKNCNKILTMLIMFIFRCQKNIYHHSNWIFQNMFKMFLKPFLKLPKKSKRWRLWQFEITRGKYPYAAYCMHLLKIFSNLNSGSICLCNVKRQEWRNIWKEEIKIRDSLLKPKKRRKKNQRYESISSI